MPVISVSLRVHIVSLCRSMDLTSQMINLTIGVWEHNNSDDAFSLLLFMLHVYMFHGKSNELEPKNNSHLY